MFLRFIEKNNKFYIIVVTVRKNSYLISEGGENVSDFEKLFDDNKNLIFKFLLKMCKNESLAEELTQETFFRAFINISQLRNKDKTEAWLCQIAKNSYFAWYNKNKNIYSIDIISDIEDTGNIEESFINKELTETALHLLHRLENPYKEVFILSVFGQLSFTEISKLFRKSESWARVTFFRAKQKISEKMRGSTDGM